MLMTLAILSLLMLCLVLWKSPTKEDMERFERGDAGQPLSAHGKDLGKNHGKQLQEQVQGGKKCPHCGKPI